MGKDTTARRQRHCLESVSLGAEQYRKLLGAVGIWVAEEYEDEGENHYFDAFKGKIV